MTSAITKILIGARCVIKGHDYIPSASRPGFHTCARCGHREPDDAPAEVIINVLAKNSETPTTSGAEPD